MSAAQARVGALWRHPIKAHGAEAIDATELRTGETMRWDRVWAIAHEAARAAPDDTGWIPCQAFSRGARSPGLMAIRAETDEEAGRVTLRHPDRPDLTVDPDDPGDAARLVDWVQPISDQTRAKPVRVVRAGPRRGMTDSDFPSVAILNRASLAALGQALGLPPGEALAMERFRGNIWLDGLAPWEEFDLVGRDIRVGDATLQVRERITRCKATMANPTTGRIDADTLGALSAGWGHQDFGVYAEVIAGGRVAVGDAAREP